MLKRLTNLWGAGSAAPATPAPDTIQLATCVLLLEAARADNVFSVEERRHIMSVLQRRFELSQDDATTLLEMAMETHDKSTSLFQYTRELNAALSLEEKVQIVEEIWRIFYADRKLDGHEDHLAAQLRNLLNINHPTMIEAKLRVLAEIREND